MVILLPLSPETKYQPNEETDRYPDTLRIDVMPHINNSTHIDPGLKMVDEIFNEEYPRLDLDHDYSLRTYHLIYCVLYWHNDPLPKYIKKNKELNSLLLEIFPCYQGVHMRKKANELKKIIEQCEQNPISQDLKSQKELRYQEFTKALFAYKKVETQCPAFKTEFIKKTLALTGKLIKLLASFTMKTFLTLEERTLLEHLKIHHNRFSNLLRQISKERGLVSRLLAWLRLLSSCLMFF